MLIRTLYVKRFLSSDLFVFSTLPQRSIAPMNLAKREILVQYINHLLDRISVGGPSSYILKDKSQVIKRHAIFMALLSYSYPAEKSSMYRKTFGAIK